MNKEEIKSVLISSGCEIVQEGRLQNDTGWQLRLRSGQIVNIFDKGTFSVQGKNPTSIQKIIDTSMKTATPSPQVGDRKAFVVYGHDQHLRNELEAMLRRWNIEPLILDQLPSHGMTVIEKLEHYRQDVKFAVILATPDDEGHRAGRPDEKAYRARQNVVMELGMMLALLGRSRVAILLKDQEKMERPSDIQGLIYIPFKDHINEAALPLAKEMNAQGLCIDLGRI